MLIGRGDWQPILSTPMGAYHDTITASPLTEGRVGGKLRRSRSTTPHRGPRVRPAQGLQVLTFLHCRTSSGRLPTRQWWPMTGLTLHTSWEPLPSVRAASFSPAVPRACHKPRSPAVSSGQSRSLGDGCWAGCTPLTWGRERAGNCMACKGSGFRSPRPTTTPQVTRSSLSNDGRQGDESGQRRRMA